MPPTADAPYARAWLGARYVVRPLGRLVLRPEVSGAARIPRERGAVLAFNHIGFLDALLVTQVLARPVRFMAAAGRAARPAGRLGLALVGRVRRPPG